MTESHLLAAILAAPEDDAPRLIYADWLEEHDQPERAEFIRVQCALATRAGEVCSSCRPGQHTNGPCRCPRDLRDIRRRERDLLRMHFGSWTNSLPESLVTKECPQCQDYPADWETGVIECSHCDCTGIVCHDDGLEFHRGFVAEIHCTLADWMEHGPAIVRAQPVEVVRLIDRRCLNHEHAWSRAHTEQGQNYHTFAHWLPSDIYDLMQPPPDNYITTFYHSDAKANAAVSVACLRWARSRRTLAC